MKGLVRTVAVAAVAAGLALVAVVLYDATGVWRALGLEAQIDEATVAVVALGLAMLMMGGGVVAWRRVRSGVRIASV
jgi:hypothetical protein